MEELWLNYIKQTLNNINEKCDMNVCHSLVLNKIFPEKKTNTVEKQKINHIK